MELCPTGHEVSPFFLFLFLQRLPKELHLILGEDDHLDLHATGITADKFWSVISTSSMALSLLWVLLPSRATSFVHCCSQGGFCAKELQVWMFTGHVSWQARLLFFQTCTHCLCLSPATLVRQMAFICSVTGPLGTRLVVAFFLSGQLRLPVTLA
jgi:hypothetical protein